ncbi:hypothetical protein FMEAI12_7010003 [Parafrankia sp. Ea1.12]|nr:hypothetical protein FMEAI12_7010003 [Parafrankia sp. Ea1.12]
MCFDSTVLNGNRYIRNVSRITDMRRTTYRNSTHGTASYWDDATRWTRFEFIKQLKRGGIRPNRENRESCIHMGRIEGK